MQLFVYPFELMFKRLYAKFFPALMVKRHMDRRQLVCLFIEREITRALLDKHFSVTFDRITDEELSFEEHVNESDNFFDKAVVRQVIRDGFTMAVKEELSPYLSSFTGEFRVKFELLIEGYALKILSPVKLLEKVGNGSSKEGRNTGDKQSDQIGRSRHSDFHHALSLMLFGPNYVEVEKNIAANNPEFQELLTYLNR